MKPGSITRLRAFRARAVKEGGTEAAGKRRRKRMKRALVLAGGGAKGSYQVGVWKALAELG